MQADVFFRDHMTIMCMTEFHIITVVSLLLITIHSMINFIDQGQSLGLLVYKSLNLLSEPLNLLSNFALR